MRLLLDTHIVLAVVRQEVEKFPAPHRQILQDDRNHFVVSAASLWEINLKWRLGKLPLEAPANHLPGILDKMGIELVPITPEHAVHLVDPLPSTNDPFDRLLLAQARLEVLQLVTVDRDLKDHPLAWQPRSA